MQKPKVLIVDDEADARETISEVIASEFSFETAGSGEEALSKLKGNKFDVVLLDIRMPKMSGIEVLKEIRSMTARTEVIMLTALDEAKLAWESSKSGAFDYITKPFNNDELILRIKIAVKRRDDMDLAGKKFELMQDIYLKANKYGGNAAKRSDLYTALYSKRGSRLENISLEELMEIAEGKWDNLDPADIEA